MTRTSATTRLKHIKRQKKKTSQVDTKAIQLEKLLAKSDLSDHLKGRLLKAFRARLSQQSTLRSIKRAPRYMSELGFGKVFEMETLRTLE